MMSTHAAHPRRLLPLLLMGCGCAPAPEPLEFQTLAAASPQALSDAREIARRPEPFLRQVLQRCERLHSYAVDFYKRERLGLWIRQLRPEQHMRVLFRARPFSVKMILRADRDFEQIAYVEGQHDGKLRCLWRRRTGQPQPQISEFDPQMAVLSGRSLNPITDFGVARLMQKVVQTLDRATAMKLPPKIDYLGIVELEKGGRPVHHLRLTYDPKTGLPNLRVDLLFHADSLLPAASYVRSRSGELEGQYIYDAFELRQFSDEDFQIAAHNP